MYATHRAAAVMVPLGAALLTLLPVPARAQQSSVGADTLEITSQRIDQLLKGLDAERPVRERLAKSTGAVGQHMGPPTAADIAKAQECGLIAMRRQESLAKANPAEARARHDSDKKAKPEDPIKRMQQIAATGDAQALQRYQDSLNRSFAEAGARARSMTGPACGSLEASASPAELAQVDSAGAKASGIELPQYVILRSRVATYFRSGGAGMAGVTFSDAEKKAIQQRGRELMPYAMMLGSSP